LRNAAEGLWGGVVWGQGGSFSFPVSRGVYQSSSRLDFPRRLLSSQGGHSAISVLAKLPIAMPTGPKKSDIGRVYVNSRVLGLWGGLRPAHLARGSLSFFLSFFLVLGFELRSYTLSHSTSPLPALFCDFFFFWR
jgi:hypothetical protein